MKIIIRSPNWIGDAVLCLSSITYLKEKMPRAHITVLAKDWVKEIFLNHPSVDEIISLDRPKISLIKNIKKLNFDVGILFTNSFSSACLFYLSGLKKRIGYKTDFRNAFLTEKIPLPKNLDKLHQRDYYLEIIKKLVSGNELPKNPFLYLTNEEITKTDRMLESLGINKDTIIIGMCPGASYGSAKMWGVKNFWSLAGKITENKNAKVLIFGSRKEEELGEIIREDIEDAINLCGKTTTRELMALIKKCDVFITNDTGPMHVASALNIPTIAIFGPTNIDRTSPLGPSVIIKKDVICSPCKHRICPSKNHECMGKISIDEVFETVEKQLK